MRSWYNSVYNLKMFLTYVLIIKILKIDHFDTKKKKR